MVILFKCKHCNATNHFYPVELSLTDGKMIEKSEICNTCGKEIKIVVKVKVEVK